MWFINILSDEKLMNMKKCFKELNSFLSMGKEKSTIALILFFIIITLMVLVKLTKTILSDSTQNIILGFAIGIMFWEILMSIIDSIKK